MKATHLGEGRPGHLSALSSPGHGRDGAGFYLLDPPSPIVPLPLESQDSQTLLPVLLVYVIDMTAPANKETPYSFYITVPGSFMDSSDRVVSIYFRPGANRSKCLPPRGHPRASETLSLPLDLSLPLGPTNGVMDRPI